MDARIAVIGTGSVGSMALWHLARAGIDAIGFERYAPGHDQAAAGGESRIFRTAYLEGPQYVPLLVRSRQLWQELEQESGRRLLTLNGGLMIGRQDSAPIVNVLKSIKDFDLPHRVLDSAEMGKDYPQHRLTDDEIGVYDEWAGVLRPEFAVAAAAACAQARGARVITGVQARIEPFDDHVVVHAGDRTWTMQTAIVTAGPWTAEFVPAIASAIQPRKLVMTWYHPSVAVEDFLPDRFPIFIHERDNAHVFGIPTLDGGSVKVAPHGSYGDLDSANDLDRNVVPGELEPINRAVEELLVGLTPTPVRVASYMDAYTTDGHGIVGLLPGTSNVWTLGAFSGHGFKMSPALGQVAAELAVSGSTDLPIQHLDPARLTGQRHR